MDQASQVGGILGIIITVVGVIYTAVNHKRLRSTCCGRKIEIAIDIESTTPPPGLKQIVVKGKSQESNLAS